MPHEKDHDLYTLCKRLEEKINYIGSDVGVIKNNVAHSSEKITSLEDDIKYAVEIVHSHDLKINTLEISANANTGNWTRIIDTGFKVVVSVVVGVLLYLMGMK